MDDHVYCNDCLQHVNRGKSKFNSKNVFQLCPTLVVANISAMRKKGQYAAEEQRCNLNVEIKVLLVNVLLVTIIKKYDN